MLTPSSTARTASAPDGAASGSSTRTAGRLLHTLARTAASAAVASSAGSDVPPGSSGASAAPSPLLTTALTTMPRPSTKTRKGTSAARTRATGATRCLASARAARTAAPARAAQAGLTPAADAPANPASVRATTARVNTGRPASSSRWSGSGRGRMDRSAAKNRLNTAYSVPMTASQGSAISAANRPKASPVAANASRLVRLDTGSSRDAEFARWVHAYTCGLARTSSRDAVAKTTGVSSTTVASRLRTAVVTDAITNTCTSSRRAPVAVERLAPVRAIHAPQAPNNPSSSHRCASTKMAARKPMTGPSCLASVIALLAPIAPAAIRMSAAGTATTASGHPRGRITAHARTAARASKAIVSPTAAFNASLLATWYESTIPARGASERPGRLPVAGGLRRWQSRPGVCGACGACGAGRTAVRVALDELAQDNRRPGDVAAGGPRHDVVGLRRVEVAGVLIDPDPGGHAGHVQLGVELGGVDAAANPEDLHRAGRRSGQQDRVAGQLADRLLVTGKGVEGGGQPAQQRVALALR